MNQLRLVLPLLPLVAGGFGCDPVGPGASGTISLGAGIDASGFATLAIRIFPDARADFDPSAPLPTVTAAFFLGRDQPLRRDDGAAALRFPYSYELGEPLGTTPDRDWRLVVSLAQAKAPISAIAPGDVFCTRRFQIAGCSLFESGYCGKTSGVDCTLDQRRQ